MNFKKLVFNSTESTDKHTAIVDFGITQEHYTIIREYNLFTVFYSRSTNGRLKTEIQTLELAIKYAQKHFEEQCQKFLNAVCE